jgi:hypothetical protein
MIRLHPILRRWKALGWLFATPLALAACSTTPKPLVPDTPPQAVQVLVPIAKPCKVEKVDPSPLVTDKMGAGDDLYEAVKRVLADRAILMADRTKLVAANSNPCPVPKP